jgi:hypothetical protein
VALLPPAPAFAPPVPPLDALDAEPPVPPLEVVCLAEPPAPLLDEAALLLDDEPPVPPLLEADCAPEPPTPLLLEAVEAAEPPPPLPLDDDPLALAVPPAPPLLLEAVEAPEPPRPLEVAEASEPPSDVGMQTPPMHVPPTQGVPSGAEGFEHVPVHQPQTPATWHPSTGMQTTGFAPTHVPAWQASACVHASPSLQGEPSGRFGFEHPMLGSHVPTPWHWSLATQVIGFAPTQTPAWHASVFVQALPSSHGLPSGTLEPTHAPAWQASFCVHALPSSHGLPSASVDQVLLELEGEQVSHAFAGFKAPSA